MLFLGDLIAVVLCMHVCCSNMCHVDVSSTQGATVKYDWSQCSIVVRVLD